jgi:hypothetical protein
MALGCALEQEEPAPQRYKNKNPGLWPGLFIEVVKD